MEMTEALRGLFSLEDAKRKYAEAVRAVQRQVLEKGCPGILVSLSGTDSAISYLICYDALKPLGMADRLWGIHYGRTRKDSDVPASANMAALFPWLRARAPEAHLEVHDLTKRGIENNDQMRWADVRYQSMNRVRVVQPDDSDDGDAAVCKLNIDAWPPGQNYWAVAPRNLTETKLGNFSLDSVGVSLVPIEDIYKTEIILLCEDIGVPEITIEYSRLPDCPCGREDIAANNIELIDGILKIEAGQETLAALEGQDPDILRQIDAYMHEKRLNNGHKMRLIAAEEGENPSFAMPMQMRRIGTGTLPTQRREAAAMFGAVAVSPPPFLKELAECCRIAGNLGFSFPIWRFLGMGLGEKTILEHAGMERLQRATDVLDPNAREPHRDLYGAGFARETDEAYIEYRRAYIAIHQKGDTPFSLILRNNAPYFGRDRLPSPAYYSTRVQNADSLRDLQPHDFAGGKWAPIERLLTDRDGPATHFLGLMRGALDALVAHDVGVSQYLVSPDGLEALNGFLARKNASSVPAIADQSVFMGWIGQDDPPWMPGNPIDITHGVDPAQIQAPPTGMKTVLLAMRDGDHPVPR